MRCARTMPRSGRKTASSSKTGRRSRTPSSRDCRTCWMPGRLIPAILKRPPHSPPCANVSMPWPAGSRRQTPPHRTPGIPWARALRHPDPRESDTGAAGLESNPWSTGRGQSLTWPHLPVAPGSALERARPALEPRGGARERGGRGRGQCCSCGLHRAAQCDPDRVGGHDRAGRARAHPGAGAGSDAVQGDHRPGEPGGQRPSHSGSRGHDLERHGDRRLDAVVRERTAGVGHLRVRGRHHPHPVQRRSPLRGYRGRRQQYQTPGLDLGCLRGPVRQRRAQDQCNGLPGAAYRGDGHGSRGGRPLPRPRPPPWSATPG